MGAGGAGVIPQMIEIIPDIRNNALVAFAPEQDLQSLADVIKQTAAGMKQSSMAAGELNQLAVELKARVSAFQVT